MTWTPPPGTIGLTHSHGSAALRAVMGPYNDDNAYDHAFIVISEREVMEPWPSGARVVPLADYADEDVAYAYLPAMINAQRHALVSAALSLDGVGYSAADYLAQRIHLRALLAPESVATRACPARVRRWAAEKTADRRTLLPAAFVAEAYRRFGMTLLPGVKPGEETIDALGTMLIASLAWQLRVPALDFGVNPAELRRRRADAS